MAVIKEWFKVIQNGAFIGAVTDQSFARYSATSGVVHICNAIEGQYLFLNDKFYRDDWMLPVDPKSYVDYEMATVVSISEKEYDILVDPTKDQPEPINVKQLINTEPEAVEHIPSESETATVEFVRERKLKELSEVCRVTIENGFSLVLSDGASHHFSMTIQDQINLADLQRAVDSGNDAVYHADGELMQFYSKEDAQDILLGANKWRTYNLVLFNSLKNWINSITDIEQIAAIAYDSEIPDEYCTDVLQVLTENF